MSTRKSIVHRAASIRFAHPLLRTAALSCLLLISLVSCNRQSVDLPDLGEVGDFQLTDQNGKTVSFSSLRGRPVVASFFFSSCPHICPTLLANVRQVHHGVNPEKATFISITTDPATDTPEHLKKFSEQFAPGQNWLFLTGNLATINSIMDKNFKVGSGDQAGDHSTRIVLVDKDQKIRGFYPGLDAPGIQELTVGLKALVS